MFLMYPLFWWLYIVLFLKKYLKQKGSEKGFNLLLDEMKYIAHIFQMTQLGVAFG